MKKILIINNDFDTMELLKQWLERKGYQVKYSGRRETIFALIREFSPHLVLIDSLQRDIAEKLKSEVHTQHIPVLMMTGYTLLQHRSRLISNDIIEKPLNLALLDKKIKQLTGQDDNKLV